MKPAPGPSAATHDWSRSVDAAHLATIRANPSFFARSGTRHLALEVVAYAVEEAQVNGGAPGTCTVVAHHDGSISVSDNGRGTATTVEAGGLPVRKPVMSTKDLRFFDADEPPLLPDGCPRRGMSVVAAMSEWLIHTNRRANGSWSQRYEHGLPATDLQSIEDNGTTGTVVHFLPTLDLRACALEFAVLRKELLTWPYLSFEFSNEFNPSSQ